ncbi:MAG TPA: YcxB family protein [Caulobacteraceae bacterium]
MPEASGEYRFGEVTAAAGVFQRRLWRGRSRFGFAGFLAVGLFGMWAAAALGSVQPDGDPLARGGVTMLAMFVVAAPVAIAYVIWRRRTIEALWRERGVFGPWTMGYVADATGLTIRQPGQQTRITWDAVTEVAPAPTHWIFFANLMGHPMPRKFFTDLAAERAFIAEVVAHLGPQARARSPEAIAFTRGDDTVFKYSWARRRRRPA